ncbi:hypothetical protein [Ideonella aquatica]|nr:hypothetical protein [Ideonella aquatica]
MRNAKLALVAVLALGLIGLVSVQAEPSKAAQDTTQPVRSAT